MLFYISCNCIFAINYSILLTAPSTQIVSNIKKHNEIADTLALPCQIPSPLQMYDTTQSGNTVAECVKLIKKSTTNQTKQKNFFSTPKKFTIFLLIKFSFCDIFFNETRQNIPNGSTILRVRLRDDNTTDPA